MTLLLDTAGVKVLMRHLQHLMDTHRDHLFELDRALGDGDLGITMTKAFAAGADEAAASKEPLPGKLLMRVGMAMAKAAPSTMGTLMATGFMRGGKAVGDAPVIGTGEAARFFRAFVDGIIERGKAKPGDKTVVDALFPAAAALEISASRGEELGAALAIAARTADEGREAAKGMASQHGKAAVFRDQTIGAEDPGAYVGALMMRGFSEAITAGTA